MDFLLGAGFVVERKVVGKSIDEEEVFFGEIGDLTLETQRSFFYGDFADQHVEEQRRSLPFSTKHNKSLSLGHFYLKLNIQLNPDSSSLNLPHCSFGNHYLCRLKIDPPIKYVLILLLRELKVIGQSSQRMEAVTQRY